MTMTWTHSGPARTSRSRRYTIHTTDPLLGTWATDQLSLVYDRLEGFFSAEQGRARTAVQMRSRVDTGLMRSMVEAMYSATPNELVLDYGWWFGMPLYAIFQEFGTRTGIEPMQAVQRTYHETVAGLKRVI